MMDQAEAARLLSDPVTLAQAKTYGPEVRAVAVWVGESGSVYFWPQAMVDNRRSRVLARIARMEGMEQPVRLHIIHCEAGVTR